MMKDTGWDEHEVNSFDNSIGVHVDSNRDRYFNAEAKQKPI